jgi:hypothetical protein
MSKTEDTIAALHEMLADGLPIPRKKAVEEAIRAITYAEFLASPWWQPDEPIPCLTIPDWAIAHAYRKAVARFDPHITPPNALVWGADVTVAANWVAEEWRKKHPDYALNPLALAEWLRIHYRCATAEDWARVPPELLWVYQSLQRLATLEISP